MMKVAGPCLFFLLTSLVWIAKALVEFPFDFTDAVLELDEANFPKDYDFPGANVGGCYDIDVSPLLTFFSNGNVSAIDLDFFDLVTGDNAAIILNEDDGGPVFLVNGGFNRFRCLFVGTASIYMDSEDFSAFYEVDLTGPEVTSCDIQYEVIEIILPFMAYSFEITPTVENRVDGGNVGEGIIKDIVFSRDSSEPVDLAETLDLSTFDKFPNWDLYQEFLYANGSGDGDFVISFDGGVDELSFIYVSNTAVKVEVLGYVPGSLDGQNFPPPIKTLWLPPTTDDDPSDVNVNDPPKDTYRVTTSTGGKEPNSPRGGVERALAVKFGVDGQITDLSSRGCSTCSRRDLQGQGDVFFAVGNFQTSTPIADPGDNGDENGGVDNGGAGGDPHFSRWHHTKRDTFHGECDLVLVKSTDFHNGNGLDVHIRTTIQNDRYSIIESVAVRIGQVLLEFDSNRIFLSGEPQSYEDLPMTVQDGEYEYTVKSMPVRGAHKRFTQIELNEDARILIKSNKIYMHAEIEGTFADLGTSVGLLGDYKTGDMLGRDGQVMSSFTDFGFEWQVQKEEARLFVDSNREPQLPYERCRMPSSAMASRRLRAIDPAFRVKAETACADSVDFETCVSDVLLTGDLDMADPLFQSI